MGGDFGLLYAFDKIHKRAKMLRLPARSLAVRFRVQRPTHRPAVQSGWQLTPLFFFTSLPVRLPLQFGLVLPEGFLFVLPLWQ